MADPNYITPAGVQKLTDELNRLRNLERPKTVNEVAEAAAHGDRSENAEYKYGKQRLREIDRRLRFLGKRLDKVVLVDPRTRKDDRVFFGATVEVVDQDDVHRTYMLVGEDETDGDRGHISWRSPVGRSLLGKRVGDVVVVHRPAGELELEVVALRYE